MNQPSLADYLQIIVTALPSEIATPSVLARIQKLASFLAPIPRAGFEIRLKNNNKQVDLQQGISSKNNEPEILAKHIAAMAEFDLRFKQPPWNYICQLCELWSNPSSCIHNGITEIWLEFDLYESNTQDLIPSIFISLNPNLTDNEEAFTVTKTALELLWNSSISDDLNRNLYRCFKTCVKPANISHIGVMLSRQAEVLRLNVSNLPPNQVATYLQEIDYPESTNEIETLVMQFLEIVDDVRVCLDVGAAIHSQVGLECSFRLQNELEPLWFTLLDNLVSLGLCTAEKRKWLLSWPGYVTPISTPQPWPDVLIAESMLQSQESLSALQRGLSHVKLTCKPQCPLEAKAYLGFIHQWLGKNTTVGSHQAQNSLACQKVDDSTPLDRNRLDSAIVAATQFLLCSRNQKGWWRDFHLYIGIEGEVRRSDEWVTAYVGDALAALPDRQAKLAAQQAWLLLINRRQSSPGWGYNGFVTPDADSTAWALRLASSLGESKSHKAREASEFIAKHFSATGGIATYLEQLAPRAYTGSAPVKGWCGVHACVTAAVASLEEIGEASRRFLRDTQDDNGSWKAYWWYDYEYATALAAESLAKDSYYHNDRQVQLAIEWARRRINSSGAVYSLQYGDNSAFATAWCVRILALAEERQQTIAELHGAVNWLLENQKPDGSWPASALLRLPASADIIDPDNHPSSAIPDDRRLFTTATVLVALSTVRKRCLL
ncbi:prenyltransferase/squalene oxidase repeat-containing protein [Aerosakkonema funiforme]|uniref:prenyltransferase/squalene oxidase repeat-containing protein n=1 Tax=Aerosakkonema funiforme TaxID=1246630 RepID=UPI0035BA734A